MPRPSQLADKRAELIPVVARAFAELGYRRATTAELAGRCGVRENILYRLWPDKKAMFIATIDYVYELSAQTWRRLMDEPGPGSTAERLLSYEAKHLGEFGNARIIFAGLNEIDDPDIRKALTAMYRRYHEFVREQIGQHRGSVAGAPDAALASWALIGLGTVATIVRELRLLSESQRAALMAEVGRLLLAGAVN